MVDRRWMNGFLRSKIREAGRQYERARGSYHEGRDSGSDPADVDAPRDDSGRVRIVCRRYAEKRAVGLDQEGRPACFDPGHPDCEGCLEDLHAGTIETW
jgi:hypothetical protein